MEQKIYGYVCAADEEERQREIEAIHSRFPEAELLVDERGRGLFDTLFFRGIREKGVQVCAESLLRIESSPRRFQYLLTYLFEHDIRLCFVREPYMDTSVYMKARGYSGGEAQDATGAETAFLLRLIKTQYTAYCESFGGAPRGVPKKRGIAKGTKLVTRKSQEAKPFILAHSRTFGGEMSNQAIMAQLGITETTLLKYKRELKQAQTAQAQ